MLYLSVMCSRVLSVHLFKQIKMQLLQLNKGRPRAQYLYLCVSLSCSCSSEFLHSVAWNMKSKQRNVAAPIHIIAFQTQILLSLLKPAIFMLIKLQTLVFSHIHNFTK